MHKLIDCNIYSVHTGAAYPNATSIELLSQGNESRPLMVDYLDARLQYAPSASHNRERRTGRANHEARRGMF